jgi:hypothetical protein
MVLHQVFLLMMTQKEKMINKAEKAYGKFLDALGCDWRNDPNSMKHLDV